MQFTHQQRTKTPHFPTEIAALLPLLGKHGAQRGAFPVIDTSSISGPAIESETTFIPPPFSSGLSLCSKFLQFGKSKENRRFKPPTAA